MKAMTQAKATAQTARGWWRIETFSGLPELQFFSWLDFLAGT